MSLNVSPALLERAEAGPVADAEFVDCIASSLPYGWKVINRVVESLAASGKEFADDNTPPPTETEQGELLRLMASDSMRAALERHFGVKLAFQNCCRVAAFRASAVGGEAHGEFVSARGQLRNQAPELVNC